MTRFWKILSGFVILAAVIGLTWIYAPPVLARAQSEPLAAAGVERWSVGTFVEGSPTYLAVTGRFLGSSGVFRSNGSDTRMAFIFSATASAKTVDAASFYILGRTGAYSGDALLSLRVYDYAGTLQRTVSAENVDLEAATAGDWVSLLLSTTPGDLVLNPGEFLAFYVELTGAASEDLDARLLFDVTVH